LIKPCVNVFIFDVNLYILLGVIKITCRSGRRMPLDSLQPAE